METIEELNKKRCGLRKIKNGEIRFFGKRYRPSEKLHTYNGELDGEYWYFRNYEYESYIYMWGSEKSYREPDAKLCDEKNVNEKGEIMWQFWDQV